MVNTIWLTRSRNQTDLHWNRECSIAVPGLSQYQLLNNKQALFVGSLFPSCQHGVPIFWVYLPACVQTLRTVCVLYEVLVAWRHQSTCNLLSLLLSQDLGWASKHAGLWQHEQWLCCHSTWCYRLYRVQWLIVFLLFIFSSSYSFSFFQLVWRE